MRNLAGKSARFWQFKVLFIAFLAVSFTSLSQKNEVDVRNISTANYPEVKGKLWVRDPEGIKTESIQFYENDVPVKVTFQSYQKVDSIATNKAILFIIRNTANKAEMQWYKDVLSSAFKNGTIKSGDKIDIVGFSCLIDKQILFPKNLNFTDNEQDLIARIDNIQSNQRIEYEGRVQTHIAINEALNLLEAQNLNLPTGLFVLSDDRSIQPGLVGELPGQRSSRLNIPIYGVSFYKQVTYFEIEDLCYQTYGRFVNEKSNDVAFVSEEISNYLKEFENRHAGLFFPFTYTSTFEKDGKSHLVKIDTKDGQSGFSLLVPSKNILELIQDNPLIFAIILLVVIGLIILLVLFYKKNKLKKEELELQREKQMSEMERQQQASDNKLSQQERELQKMKEDERQEAENLNRQKQEEAQVQEDEIQLQKMLERGNFPWFEFRFADETGSYQIQTPRLSVGRDASNTWTINHPTISRNHFQLHFKNHVYTLRDLGSSNGLFVNDIKVTEIELKHGDCIQAGEILMTFHI